MSFLSPLAALVALAALLPLGAAWVGRARVARVRGALGLPPPPRPSGLSRLLCATAGVAVLGVAAAQPVLVHGGHRQRTRTDAQALFVLDTSRSMAAAASRTSATRLDRAVRAAVRLRAAIPEVPSGVATLTDRVLPDLLPVPDQGTFEGVARRAVAIEAPPPRGAGIRATAYGALGQIASGDYFDDKAKRRLVVLLTDGESNPVNAGAVARSLAAARGYRLVAVRLWHDRESVYDSNGKAEPGYRPDPTGRVVLDTLASAAGGRAFDEGQVGAAASYLRGLAGHGATRSIRAGARTTTPLAPYLAAVALLLVLASVWPVQARFRQVGSARQ